MGYQGDGVSNLELQLQQATDDVCTLSEMLLEARTRSKELDTELEDLRGMVGALLTGRR